jgi:hypothetical protein
MAIFGCVWVLGTAMDTGHLLHRTSLIGTHHPPSLTQCSLGQITSALTACGYPSRVARPTVRAVDIGSSFRLGEHLLIGDQLLTLGLFKLHILRLRGATGLAGLLQVRINAVTVRAGPLKFNVSEFFACHMNNSSKKKIVLGFNVNPEVARVKEK